MLTYTAFLQHNYLFTSTQLHSLVYQSHWKSLNRDGYCSGGAEKWCFVTHKNNWLYGEGWFLTPDRQPRNLISRWMFGCHYCNHYNGWCLEARAPNAAELTSLLCLCDTPPLQTASCQSPFLSFPENKEIYLLLFWAVLCLLQTKLQLKTSSYPPHLLLLLTFPLSSTSSSVLLCLMLSPSVTGLKVQTIQNGVFTLQTNHGSVWPKLRPPHFTCYRLLL